MLRGPLIPLLALCACHPACATHDTRAAKAEGHGPPQPAAPPVNAEDLATVVLAGESERALGIAVTAVERVRAPRTFTVGGQVVVPAGRTAALSAPASGRISAVRGRFPRPGQRVKVGQVLLSLVPFASIDRDVRARATEALEAARAAKTLAVARETRAEAMLAERSGSQRNLEEARAGQQVASAAVVAAQSRLDTLRAGSLDADVTLALRSTVDGVIQTVRVTPGEAVPQGAPLIDIAGTGRWVRAALAGGDVAPGLEATVAAARRLGSDARLALQPIDAPPMPDPVRGTLDRFFLLPAEADWAPGERVLVDVETAATTEALAVPLASVVRDAEGGAWVYVRQAAGRYRRTRVEPLRRERQLMLLARGPSEGSAVVAVGAVELWGHELGADR